MDWRNLMKQSVTVGAQLLWGGRYGCNNGRYGCTIVMSYIEINKAVSQCLLTFNLCVSINSPLTCAFHIPCTHTPEIIDMHRGVCDNLSTLESGTNRRTHEIGLASPFYCKDVVCNEFTSQSADVCNVPHEMGTWFSLDDLSWINTGRIYPYTSGLLHWCPAKWYDCTIVVVQITQTRRMCK